MYGCTLKLDTRDFGHHKYSEYTNLLTLKLITLILKVVEELHYFIVIFETSPRQGGNFSGKTRSTGLQDLVRWTTGLGPADQWTCSISPVDHRTKTCCPVDLVR